MIYQGLARVVTEAGRRRRLRSVISFLAEELAAAEMGTLEDEHEVEGDDILVVRDNGIIVVKEDGEVDEAVAMMVEEALIFSCLASVLLTVVWYRIMINRSINFMCWFK